MRVLISSKVLQTGLMRFDLHFNPIRTAIINIAGSGVWEFSLISDVHIERIDCEVLSKAYERKNQAGRKWDWVLELVSRVDEQPIVLDIHEKTINVIFQY